MSTNSWTAPTALAHRELGCPTRPSRGLACVRRELTVRQPVDEVFAFFADACNLNIITPPWIGFTILTPAPIAMRRGARIDYRIRIRGVPVSWNTVITEWEPPYRFVDLQLKGPYRWWHHEHRFEACAEGTRIIDEVEFLAPLHWVTHPLFVSRDVERIFDYRSRALQLLFRVTDGNEHEGTSLSQRLSSAPKTEPRRHDFV